MNVEQKDKDSLQNHPSAGTSTSVITASVTVISTSGSNWDEVMLGQTTATAKLQKHQWMFTRVNIPNQNSTSVTG